MENQLKSVINGNVLDQEIEKAFKLIEETVGTTMGYYGKTVLIQDRYHAYKNTKDGVTVAAALKGDTRTQDIILNIIRAVALKTDEEVGDGTTTSIIFTLGLYKAMKKIISQAEDDSVVNRFRVKEGMEKALSLILDELKIYRADVKQSESKKLEQIARIAMNNDELAPMISELISKYGESALLMCKNTKKKNTYYEVSQGFTYNEGLFSSQFLPNGLDPITTDSLSVVIGDYTLTPELFNHHILPGVEEALNSDKNLLLVVNDTTKMMLDYILSRNADYAGKIYLVRTPYDIQGKSEELVDLAKIAGTKIFTEADAKKPLSPDDLGFIPKITLDQSSCRIIYESSKEVKNHIKALEDKLKNLDLDSEIEKLKKRIAQLKGVSITLYISAQSYAELIERKDRIEDGFNACKQALIGGIIPGGGNPLAYIGSYLGYKIKKYTNNKDEQLGFAIVCEGIKEPLKKNYENALIPYNEGVIQAVRGVDMASLKRVDLIEKGIIDPYNVIESSLVNALSSISALMLTNTVLLDLNSNE